MGGSQQPPSLYQQSMMVPGCSQWCLVRGQRIMRAVLKQKFRDKLCYPEGNQGQERAAKGCCVTSILGGFCSKTGLHQQEGTDNEAWGGTHVFTWHMTYTNFLIFPQCSQSSPSCLPVHFIPLVTFLIHSLSH